MYDVKQDTWILDNMLFVRLKNQVVHKQHSHIGVLIFQVGESSVQGEGNRMVVLTILF